MKYPEYDSPFELVISDITTQMAKNIDEMCWQAAQRVGVGVNKDKLLLALEYDSARYREAFHRGEETGYAKRDEEIVRCKDCKRWSEVNESYYGRCDHVKRLTQFDWFCADGERKEHDLTQEETWS